MSTQRFWPASLATGAFLDLFHQLQIRPLIQLFSLQTNIKRTSLETSLDPDPGDCPRKSCCNQPIVQHSLTNIVLLTLLRLREAHAENYIIHTEMKHSANSLKVVLLSNEWDRRFSFQISMQYWCLGSFVVVTFYFWQTKFQNLECHKWAEQVLNVVYCMQINSSFLELFQSYFLIYSWLIVNGSLDVRKSQDFSVFNVLIRQITLVVAF